MNYREQVASMVRSLRADPYDEPTRLVLADVLEEGGRDGVHDRCSAPLRSGNIPMATFDVKLASSLATLGWEHGQRCYLKVTAREPYLLPSELCELWNLGITEKDKLSDELKAEAELVAEERRANGKELYTVIVDFSVRKLENGEWKADAFAFGQLLVCAEAPSREAALLLLSLRLDTLQQAIAPAVAKIEESANKEPTDDV